MEIKRRSPLGRLFGFVLLAVLAVFSLLMVVAGLRVYRSVAEGAELRSERRTALNYLANKVRSSNGCELFEFDGLEVLALDGGGDYLTYIYFSDGGLREYYGAKDREFRADFGESIASVKGLKVELVQNGLRFCLTDGSGRESELFVAPRAGGKS